jgi:hypothetical protein
MKKRFLSYALFFSVVLIVLLNIDYSNALVYQTDCLTAVEPVCGQCPDSSRGYGQVIILDVPNSCNNFADGFCPEDYQNGSTDAVFGNCSNCHDPDCTGTVIGKVYAFTGLPISRAVVKALPIRYNLSAPTLERNATTDVNGNFDLYGVTTGTYYFSASHEGFDTQVLSVTVLRNKTTTNITFNLANGTCFDDCTNSYGRCNAQCDGLTFKNDTTKCIFYNSTSIDAASICDNRLKGTEVIIPNTFNGTHAQFIDCCEGTPYWKYYQPVTVSTSTINNLAKIETLVNYNDQPVKIIVAYWPNLN